MQASHFFKNKILMITGGTGSFGSTVLKHFLDSDLSQIRIFSRDEKSRMICDIFYRQNIRDIQIR